MLTDSSYSQNPNLRYCNEIVQDVSRTFALTIDLLDDPLSDRISLGYLLCRIPDTIEDSNRIPPDEQSRLLSLYADVVDYSSHVTIEDFREEVDSWLPTDPDPDWEVVANSPKIYETFSSQPLAVQTAIREPVTELATGMSGFIDRYSDDGGLRIQTAVELDQYCHFVAGTVGELITNLFRREDISAHRARTLAINFEHFGQLLQLVNIAKDVYQDYTSENNVYLPSSWLADENVSQENILEPDNREGVAQVIGRITERARTHLPYAREYLEMMPLTGGNTRAAWIAPYLLAIGTLREIDENPTDPVTPASVKVSRDEVQAITILSSFNSLNIQKAEDIIAQRPLRQDTILDWDD